MIFVSAHLENKVAEVKYLKEAEKLNGGPLDFRTFKDTMYKWSN